jgi:hypothetical protein
MDLTLREGYSTSFCMKLIAVIPTIIITVTLFVSWYNNRLLTLIRQFFLIPNRINEFVDRRQ